MILTIIIFIAFLSALILIHEWGHFISARRLGMRVEEFGFGFPPRIFKMRHSGVLYSLNLFPIGGFVRVFGEDGSHKDNQKSFAAKSKGARAFVVLAGILMNFFLAFILFSVIHALGAPQELSNDGMPQHVKNISVFVAGISPDSPAENSGLQNKDKIIELRAGDDSTPAQTITGVQEFINAHRGREVTFSIMRDGVQMERSVFARYTMPEGEGATGIGLIRIGEVVSPWYEAPWDGLQTTASLTIGTVKAFGRAISQAVFSGQVPQDLAGPVGIVSIAQDVRDMGFVFFLQLVALISLNLAIINIVPFPALDGGRLAFIIVEAIKGSPVNKNLESRIHAAGFVLLILLIIFITINDVNKFF